MKLNFQLNHINNKNNSSLSNIFKTRIYEKLNLGLSNFFTTETTNWLLLNINDTGGQCKWKHWNISNNFRSLAGRYFTSKFRYKSAVLRLCTAKLSHGLLVLRFRDPDKSFHLFGATIKVRWSTTYPNGEDQDDTNHTLFILSWSRLRADERRSVEEPIIGVQRY